MDAGEVLAVPVDQDGKAANPYLPAGSPFSRAGWRGIVVATATQVFGYLAVYVPLVSHDVTPGHAIPTLDTLRAQSAWTLQLPGTCSRAHFRKLGLERVGRVELTPGLAQHDPADLASYAIADVSIANRIVPDRKAPRGPLPTR